MNQLRERMHRLRRELPLAAAVAALGSLLWAPSFLSSPALPGGTLEELRAAVERKEFESAEAGLRSFLRTHPHGPPAERASLLLAEALLGHPGTGPSRLEEAWIRAASALPLRRRVAAALHERGFSRESAACHRELWSRTGDPDAALVLAEDLAALAALEPDREETHLREALAMLEEYFRLADPRRRQTQVLSQARLLWRVRRYEEMLSLLRGALSQAADPALAGRLQLERGKALVRLRRPAEAHAALDEAEELLQKEPALRDQALLFKAELYGRAGNPEGDAIVQRLVRARSPLAPAARLQKGLRDLERGAPEAPATLQAGLAELSTPAPLQEAGFDLSELLAALRASAELGTREAVYRELGRLFPGSREAQLDHARLLRRLREHARAAERFVAAGAWREAAEACFEGGFHLRAAALFARAGDLLGQAESLRRAGVYEEALVLLAKVVASSPSDAPRLADAVLARGRILAELGRREEALDEFRRIVEAADLPADPRTDAWAEALFETGRLLAESDYRRGRRALAEVVERYAGERRPLAARAAFLLARSAVTHRDWTEALERLRQVETLAPGADLLGEARLLRGEILYAQRDYAGAASLFGSLFEGAAAAEERLQGLIGRARAYARLGRREEARRDLEQGLRLHAGAREELDRSMAGRGRAYWSAALRDLGDELQ